MRHNCIFMQYMIEFVRKPDIMNINVETLIINPNVKRYILN